jgi:hypothetical protein
MERLGGASRTSASRLAGSTLRHRLIDPDRGYRSIAIAVALGVGAWTRDCRGVAVDAVDPRLPADHSWW